jgi:hypothetical protein
MPTVKSANTTKYDAGGTGDNLIPDGYIKSVEKVWIDTYTFSAAATIGIGLVIEVAIIPAGKKITGIDVYGLGIGTSTTATVQIGTKIAAGTSHATLFLAATTYGTTALGAIITGKISATTNIPYELTGGTNRIFLLFAGANPTVTAGTITTVVRYT